MGEIAAMVVAIVAITCAAGVINDYFKTKRVAATSGLGNDARAEIEALKRRVAVLEEIVTDDRYRLNKELDQLERQA